MKHLLAVIMLLLGLHQVAAGAPGPGGANVPATATGSSAVVKMPGQNSISIDAGTGRLLQLSQPAASVFAAEPKIAEVRPASATSLFIFGVAPGRTTVAALDGSGKPIAQYDVVVQPSKYGAGEAEAMIARALPGAAVHVDTLQNGLSITGKVKSAADADRVMQIVRGYASKDQTVENRLSVASSIQVNLRAYR